MSTGAPAIEIFEKYTATLAVTFCGRALEMPVEGLLWRSHEG